MATYTSNINLKKPANNDKIRIADFNTNADNIDAAIGAGFGQGTAPSINQAINSLADGLAIIANGNVHAAITAGQFVYVRGHGTLAEGLYTADSNISANGELSSSNLTADTSGGLNALRSKITTGNVTSSITVSSTKGTISSMSAYRIGNVVSLAFVIATNTSIASDEILSISATFTDTALKPTNRQPGSSNSIALGSINISPSTAGADLVARATMSLSSGFTTWICYTYVCNG